MKALPPTAAVLAAATTILAAATVLAGESPKKLKTFYLGNSYTGNSMPGLHGKLGESAGKDWEVIANISPGIPIWMHMKQIMDAEKPGKKGAAGKKFLEHAPTTDAIVMLHYAGTKNLVKSEMWQGKVKFDQPTDLGDAPASVHIIKEYIKLNPKGKAYVYAPWPSIPGMNEYKERVQEEARQSATSEGENRGEVMKKIKHRKLNQEEMADAQLGMDYPKEWLWEYDQTQCNPVGDTKAHCRDHFHDTMEQLKNEFPELWKNRQLAMIPVGEVFYELDKKMRDGKVPGLTNVGQFSADGGHVRSELPRYVIAATHYAVLFNDHPKNLDHEIFNQWSNYVDEERVKAGKPNVVNGYYTHPPDLGTLLEITPEIAKVVDETIWETVKKHPYTQMDR